MSFRVDVLLCFKAHCFWVYSDLALVVLPKKLGLKPLKRIKSSSDKDFSSSLLTEEWCKI